MKNIGTASICLLLAFTGDAFAQTSNWGVFYPLKVGNRWTYVASGSTSAKDPQKKADKGKDADASKKVVIEVERAEDYVRKDMKDGKPIEEKFPGFILKLTSGDRVARQHVAILADGVHRISENDRTITPPLLILKFGLKNVGQSWDWDSKTETTPIRGTCTIGSEDVRVPYKDGTPLQTLTVTFSNKKAGDDRQEITTWFVREIGMVKQQIRMKNHNRVLELIRFEPAK